MNDPTFKAIERKVNLALCFVAVVIVVGLTFSSFATAKSMAGTEYRFLEIILQLSLMTLNCAAVQSQVLHLINVLLMRSQFEIHLN